MNYWSLGQLYMSLENQQVPNYLRKETNISV